MIGPCSSSARQGMSRRPNETPRLWTMPSFGPFAHSDKRLAVISFDRNAVESVHRKTVGVGKTKFKPCDPVSRQPRIDTPGKPLDGPRVAA